jgi:hypothetical protein
MTDAIRPLLADRLVALIVDPARKGQVLTNHALNEGPHDVESN